MKFINIKCSNTTEVTAANSVAVFSAFFKLILSGVTDPEAYTADPVCGQFCATSGMTLTHSGDTVIYPIAETASGDFTVDYGNFKIRCLSRKVGASSTFAAVFAIPFVDSEICYNSSASLAAPSASTVYQRSSSPPTGTLDMAKNHYLRYPKNNTSMNLMVMIDVLNGLIMISNDQIGGYFDTTKRNLHSTIWQKSGDDSFYSASFLTSFTSTVSTCFTLFDTSPNGSPFSLMTSIGPVATGFSNSDSVRDVVNKTILMRKTLTQATGKPVLGLKGYFPDREFDFSSAFLIADYDTESEISTSVLNNGVTYDTYGHFFLARA